MDGLGGEGGAGLRHTQSGCRCRVGNENGELLLIQRADSGIWLYPTGWCDVGYSAAEVVVKEVEEETGILVEPVRLIAVLDGLRLGFTRVPLYSLLFYCRAWAARSPPIPSRPAPWAGSPARPCHSRSSARSDGASTSSPPSTASTATCSTTACANRCGGADRPTRQICRLGRFVITVEPAASVDDDLVTAVTVLIPQLSRSSPPPSRQALERIVAEPGTTLFVARDAGRIVGILTLAAFLIPTAYRGWIEDVVVDEAARWQGGGGRPRPGRARPRGDLGCRTVDLTSRPDREAANRLYVGWGSRRASPTCSAMTWRVHREVLPIRGKSAARGGAATSNPARGRQGRIS